MIDRTRIRIAIFAAIIGLLPVNALAAVALAVGVTGHANDGLAFGDSYNYDSEQEAGDTALAQCRNYKTAPKAARSCRLIGSMSNGCIAIAFDPKSDSPGVGWAIAKERDEAERRALDDCRATAPASRRQFCKTAITRCDGDTPPKK